VYGWIAPQQSKEEPRVGLLVTGNLEEKTVHNTAQAYTLFDVKGDIETLLESSIVGDRAVRFIAGEGVAKHWSPDAAGEIWLEQAKLGCFGQLHPGICEDYKIRQPVFAAEIELGLLYPLWGAGPKARTIPRFPSIQRDLSIVVDRAITYGEIESAIGETQIEELIQVYPFDLYQGDPLPLGKKGISITLVYQRLDRTLVEEDANRFDRVVLAHLRDRLGAELRR
jgi:phenylalanyl-tRNA synthetase beta chain